MDLLRIASPVARRATFACLLVVISASAQTEKLQFEVASVRQSKSDARPQSNFALDSGYVFSTIGRDDTFVPAGGLLAATNWSLLTYIGFAYKLTGTQFLSLRFKEYLGQTADLPKWAGAEQFDIQARAAGNPTKDQMRAMMRTLLEERFKLVVHRETREVAVLALVQTQQGKLGPKLRFHPAGDVCADELPGYPRVCGVIAHLAPSVPGRSSFGARHVSLALLASSLPTQTGLGALRKPVIDKTGLSGGYDFALEWVPDGVEVSGPGFEGALKEQLGLKLVSDKGAVEVLVIDHVEEPSAN